MRTLITAALLTITGCLNASDSTVIGAAESAGLHDVKPTGLALMSCAKGDTFRSHFTAKTSDGKPVRGTVCCGWLKDCTVRFAP